MNTPFLLGSFLDAIARASERVWQRRYAAAFDAYLEAARLAPHEATATFCLEQAWISAERYYGRRSELEP